MRLWNGRLLSLLLLGSLLLSFPGTGEAVVTLSASLRSLNGSEAGSWVSVTISNPSSRPVEGQLEFNGFGTAGISVATVSVATIPPGASHALNVYVPVINVTTGVFREAGGDATPLNLNMRMSYQTKALYLYGSDSANRLSDSELEAFTYRLSPGTGAGYVYISGTATGTTRSLAQSELAVSQILTTELPENWLCYTPLQSVILSASDYRSLTPRRRQALDTWLNLGGNLTLFGEDESSTQIVHRGRINHTSINPILDPAARLDTEPEPFPILKELNEITNPYREGRPGGRGGAFLLATLFLVTAGPLNYFYFSRRNQIRKLLITVPLISLGFCSLIAGYFVFTQGFSRKGGSVSITTVDESANRAVTFAKHSLLSGLYPLGGFHFAAETFFDPQQLGQHDGARFDLTRETVLESGIFKPGIPLDYTTIFPYTTHERMVLSTDAHSFRNGFELPVKAVAVLQDSQYLTGGAASPGARIKLSPASAPNTSGEQMGKTDQAQKAAHLVRLAGKQLLSTSELDVAAALAQTVMNYQETTGTGALYVAIVDGIPKSAQPGVEISEGKNLHLLIGRTARPAKDPLP